MTNINLYFVKSADGRKQVVRIQSDTKLIKELLKDFEGKIKIETSNVETLKERLCSLGAKKEMFK